MKLRITDNSLRFRVTQSELATLIEAGRIEKTIHFAADEYSRLTYALEHHPSSAAARLRYRALDVTVVLSTKEVQTWGKTDQVGIYATVDLGEYGNLDILVEKDFACLDLSDAENVDTFPNPNACVQR
jgi:hypothetical protein